MKRSFDIEKYVLTYSDFNFWKEERVLSMAYQGGGAGTIVRIVRLYTPKCLTVRHFGRKKTREGTGLSLTRSTEVFRFLWHMDNDLLNASRHSQKEASFD